MRYTFYNKEMNPNYFFTDNWTVYNFAKTVFERDLLQIYSIK